MKRVAITGGTGFVGVNLARRLLADGHEVHALLRPGYQPWRIEAIRDDLRLHIVDLADRAAARAVIEQIQPEWVFHLAAHGAYSYQQDADQIVRTNLTSTIHLLDACLDVGCAAFVNAGSSSEYGYKDHAPDELEAVDPNSTYAVTKAAAAHYCRFRSISRGAHVVTLRLYSVYGAYEEPTRLIPRLAAFGMRGQLPPLVNPDIARDYVYVDDVCEAFIRAASLPSEPGAIYNVGTGVQTTLRQAVETVKRVLAFDAEPQWGSMPDRAWDTTVWVANPARIKAALGWEPRWTFERGFAAFADWLRAAVEHHERYEVQL
jgi:nucleoside-diphosphate-sugar epimerase